MDYALYIAGAIVFFPALVLMYRILKGYTYPAVEDPFFKDSTLFTIFAVGLIEGFVKLSFGNHFSTVIESEVFGI